MNSIFADFDGGQISRTDYFQSRDCEEGRAWLAIHGGCWHVLIPPRCSCRPSVARARPVVDHDELDGWRWRLEIAGQRLLLAYYCVVARQLDELVLGVFQFRTSSPNEWEMSTIFTERSLTVASLADTSQRLPGCHLQNSPATRRQRLPPHLRFC